MPLGGPGKAKRIFADFEAVLPCVVLETLLEEHGPRKRCPARLSARELVAGLVYHVGQKSGRLGAHLEQLTGKKISEASASERRLSMPWEVFEAVLEEALVPLADPALLPEAFYAGLRLAGIDGTQFSLLNTPRILGAMTKPASRRFQAAFAKLGCAVLVELGTHAPLAAAIAEPQGKGESEAALAAQLLCRLPAESLLLGDRLYGNGAFIARLWMGAPAGTAQAFLLRVSQTPRPRLIEILADGSALMEVRLAREEAQLLERKTMRVREIRGRVRRPGKAWSEVRLWTSLLDAKAHPALESCWAFMPAVGNRKSPIMNSRWSCAAAGICLWLVTPRKLPPRRSPRFWWPWRWWRAPACRLPKASEQLLCG